MEMYPVTEAKAKLSEIVERAEDTDVFLLRHGRPTAVVMSARRHEMMLEELEDLRDRLSVHEAEGLPMSLDKLKAELGMHS